MYVHQSIKTSKSRQTTKLLNWRFRSNGDRLRCHLNSMSVVINWQLGQACNKLIALFAFIVSLFSLWCNKDGLIFHFFARWHTAEALRANIGSKLAISLERGPADPKFQVEGVAPENWAKWSFVRYKNLDISFFRFVTMHAFYRRTGGQDRQTGIFHIAS